jgi:hypothetical protein
VNATSVNSTAGFPETLFKPISRSMPARVRGNGDDAGARREGVAPRINRVFSNQSAAGRFSNIRLMAPGSSTRTSNKVASQKTGKSSRTASQSPEPNPQDTKQQASEPIAAFASLVNFLLQPPEISDPNNPDQTAISNGGSGGQAAHPALTDNQNTSGYGSDAAGLQTASPAQIADALIQSMLGGSFLEGPLRKRATAAAGGPAVSSGVMPGGARARHSQSGDLTAAGMNLAAFLNLSECGQLPLSPPALSNLKATGDGSAHSATGAGDSVAASSDPRAVSTTGHSTSWSKSAVVASGELAFGALLTPHPQSGPSSLNHTPLGHLDGSESGDAGGMVLRTASASGNPCLSGGGGGERDSDPPAGRATSQGEGLPGSQPRALLEGAVSFANMAAAGQAAPANSGSRLETKQLETGRLVAPQAAAIAEPSATPLSSTRIHDLTVRVSSPGAAPVDLQVSQRSGEVHVAVRTSDGLLQSSLRQNLPNLLESLDKVGFHTETFLPHNGLAESASGLNTLAQAAGVRGSNNGQEPSQNHPQDSPKNSGPASGQQPGQGTDGFHGSNRQQQQHQRQQRDRNPRRHIALLPGDWFANSLGAPLH